MKNYQTQSNLDGTHAENGQSSAIVPDGPMIMTPKNQRNNDAQQTNGGTSNKDAAQNTT